jgi:ubiquinone/menaquinone biosynthesis C-methylase UbiE
MRRYYEDLWEALPERLGPPPLLERRRDLLLAHVAPGRRVLDLGCGEGAFAALIAGAGGEAVGADVAEAALARARARHPGPRYVLVAPHGPLPFPDAHFDAVWASEVIEHVADTARWLSEVRRVLRARGALLVTTPYHGRVKGALAALAGFDRAFDPRADHLRFYTRRSLRELLEDFGFEAVEIATAGGPPLLRETILASARRAAP